MERTHGRVARVAMTGAYRGARPFLWSEHPAHHEAVERPWNVTRIHLRTHHPRVDRAGEDTPAIC